MHELIHNGYRRKIICTVEISSKHSKEARVAARARGRRRGPQQPQRTKSKGV